MYDLKAQSLQRVAAVAVLFIMRVGVVHQNMMPMLNDRLL